MLGRVQSDFALSGTSLYHTGRYVVERQVLSTSASGAPLAARERFPVTVEDQRCLFEKGRVASIGAFGAVRLDAGAASGATHQRVRWCRVKPHLEHNGSILCGAYK
jgi:hypothetical protein